MEHEQGYIKKVLVLYIKTNLGDKWMDKVACEFIELKNEKGYIVEEITNKE